MSASAAPAVATRHTEGRFAGAEGRQIYWQSWLPEEDPHAIVVIAHGASEHGGRYRYVVERLVPMGFGVYAIDHRGHGHSEGRRAQLDRMRHVVADLDHLVDDVHRNHPRCKRFLLGHSMGGCIAIDYALVHQEKLDGLILSAPLAALAAAPAPLRALAKLLSVAVPDVGVYQVESNAVSRDPDEVRAYREDPLVYNGKLPARTIQELADTVRRFPIDSRELTLPLLMMIGTADELVPPEGGRTVFANAGSTDKTIKEYDGFFHEIFNEPPGERDRPLSDLADWLAARTP